MKNQTYPVGYTVMPVYKVKKLNEYLSKDNEEKEIVAYMPSKCYVVSVERQITKDGSIKSSYGVVYPYVPGKAVSQNYYMSNYPKYDNNGNCSNSGKTQYLTDNFEAAMEEALVKNRRILDTTNYSITAETNYLTNKEKHRDLILNYVKASTYLEDMSSDIEVTIDEFSDISTKKQILK